MLSKQTAIGIVHRGRAAYLNKVLALACLASPDQRVYHVGDEKEYDGASFVPCQDLDSVAGQEFKSIYVHRSALPYEWELFCWLRWFHLRELMQRENLEEMLVLDSDVLLYSSMSTLRKIYGQEQFSCGLCYPEKPVTAMEWAASGHFSYWTRSALEDFCAFTLTSFQEEKSRWLYEKKWEWHQQFGQPGGVCDMTGLYLFALQYPSGVFNFTQEHRGTVVDNNLNNKSNYRENEYYSRAHKKTYFFFGHPYFKSKRTKKLRKVHAVHLQGQAKKLIDLFPVQRVIFRAIV